MNSSKPATVSEYLAQLPEDRRPTIKKLRGLIRKNLPKGYRERVNWGMLAYEIPLSRYPETYNGQPLMLLALHAQKSHYALYLMNVYGDPAVETWFRRAFKAAGKKLDMGKSCVRFKSLDDLPLDVIGEVVGKTSVEQFVKNYEAVKRPSKK